MKRTTRCYLLAWLAVPLAFAAYISFAYTNALTVGLLPFLGPREWKWWVAFTASLLIGTWCIAAARPYDGARWVVRLLLYFLAMAILLASLHLSVACIHGDCL
jgi:hypothetical protein